MKRFAIITAALVLGLAVVGSAEAAPKGGNGVSSGGARQVTSSTTVTRSVTLPTSNVHATTTIKHVVPVHKTTTPVIQHVNNQHITTHHITKVPAHGHQTFLTTHAKQYSFGYCYFGNHHKHWTYSCWSPTYGCNIHWCQYACCYYYWCAPHGCYYPVTYCPTGFYAY